MSYPSTFWDRIAPRYAKSAIADEASYHHKLAVTRQHFTPDSEVLEIGCGTGATAIEHAPHVAHYLATDISSGMLDIARSKANGQANLSFERTAIEDIPGAERFDVVLAMSILHLVDDLEATLGHVHRLLRPGGVFASSTVCMSDGYGWFALVGSIGYRLGLVPASTNVQARSAGSLHRVRRFPHRVSFSADTAQATFLVATRK